MLIVAILALTGCGNKDEGIVGSWSYSRYGSTEYVLHLMLTRQEIMMLEDL